MTALRGVDDIAVAQAPIGVEAELPPQRVAVGSRAIAVNVDAVLDDLDTRAGESIDPAWVAYVISKEELPGFTAPRWLELLKPVLCGSFAADNMDYVPRDAYMCGVSIGPVDVRRIIHYTFISPEGMALHQHGAEAMLLFLNELRDSLRALLFHLDEAQAAKPLVPALVFLRVDNHRCRAVAFCDADTEIKSDQVTWAETLR